MISLKFVPNGQINIISELVQIMAWRRRGDKPLSEPMMDKLLTHICITRPQWVWRHMYHQTSNISHTLVGNEIVDHSDVVGASPVGAAPHDDVIKWKHFPRYWPFMQGIHRPPVHSPSQMPVTRSFDVLFDPRLNKRLSKPLWGWWFEMPSCSLWRHCNKLHRYLLSRLPGFNGLGKDNCKTRRETFMFWDLIRLILEVWRYVESYDSRDAKVTIHSTW